MMNEDEYKTKRCNDATALKLQVLNCLFKFFALCKVSKQTLEKTYFVKDSFVHPVSDYLNCKPTKGECRHAALI